MATLGLSKVFILDKYFTELQKFWETEKKLQDASSSNEAVHLQRRLLTLSSELVSLRNHLHHHPPTPNKAPSPQPAVPPRAPHSQPPPQPAPPQDPRFRSSVPTPASATCAVTVGGAVTAGGAVTSGGAVTAGGDVDDLIQLRGPLTEDAVVRALQTRFYHNKFFTWIGPILVAVNGYLEATGGGAGAALSAAGGRGAARPELARLVQDAVRHQADSGYPQAIILSGVSGSGKTFLSMVALRRLWEVAGGGPETDAFKHLAAAFTVLRSLGTAHTAHNHHSTRIGHFIEVQVTDGALYRTKIHCYFLDQTRVVRPPAGERNYHIFYQMLAGLSAEERAQLRLDGLAAADLRYLSAGGAGGGVAARRGAAQADAEDGARFRAWKQCLAVLGIPCADVLRVLAAVMLLGNVQFTEGAEGGAEPSSECELSAVAALLGVGAGTLRRGLVTRVPPPPPSARVAPPSTRSAPRPAVRAPATPPAAEQARDALAKALYSRTVATIVRRANSLKRLGSTLGTLSSDSAESVAHDAASRRTSSGGGAVGARSMAALNSAVRHATDGFVGILDMFGFEECAPSRLEHLCANLCAETMQHFYNTHVFKSCGEACREEGVTVPLAPLYADNVPAIDLLSSLRCGLLAALDAECRDARATPERYVVRIKHAHRGHGRLLEGRGGGAAAARRFAVRHFAGDVTYDATDFLEANRDLVPDDLVAAFDTRLCDFGFATHLFGTELKALNAAGGPSGSMFRASPTAAAAAAAGVSAGGEGTATLTQDFHTRLDNLLRTLVHARPHFVRCLRANQAEAPMIFERATVAKQVRALQVLETVQLMAGGFPHRMRFRAFHGRFRALCGRHRRRRDDSPAACAAVLQAAAAAATPPAPNAAAVVRWAVGKRHVFLSEAMRQVLERMRRARREAAAECIQTAWRQYRNRVGAIPAGAARPPVPAPAPATATMARPRPAPIAGTPPPDPADKCDPAIVKKTCSLFGLDLERPPPLPPPRAYTVAGGVKLGYPQCRSVAAEWRGDVVTLRPGDTVTAVGAAERGHLAVQVGSVTVTVPHHVLSPPRAPPSRHHPPPPPPPPAAP